MKKIFACTAVLTLGAATVAFAANPFSDVPKGHWSYDAVAKLADAGIVEGYTDGSFYGDKTITRYEMAQIIAKAMAKGAIGADSRLVAEYAAELDGLGVRVARLEKKADNVRINGQVQISYRNQDRNTGNETWMGGEMRSRLYIKGHINDVWDYHACIENDQYFGGGSSARGEDIPDLGLEFCAWQRAYLTGRVGGVKTQLGRYETYIANGEVYTQRVDGIKVDYGKNLRLTLEAGKMWQSCDNKSTAAGPDIGDGFWRATVNYDFGKRWNVQANFLKANDTCYMMGTNLAPGTIRTDTRIATLGVKYTGKNFWASALYINSLAENKLLGDDLDGNGYILNLRYKGARAQKVGSWGVYGRYYNAPAAGILYNNVAMNNMAYFKNCGIKGWMLGANLTVAPNMVACFEYYDLKGKNNSDVYQKTMWTSLTVTF